MKGVCFISGPLDISQEEWNAHYKDQIDKAIESNYNFVVGDARGTDAMSSQYLWDKNVFDVYVFHTFYKARNNPGYPTICGFETDLERDETMTSVSEIDIAWVRSEEESKKLYGEKYKPGRISGTQKNIERRASAKQ